MPARGVACDDPSPGPPESGGSGQSRLPSGGSLAASTLAIDRRAATGIGLAPARTGCAIARSATVCLGDLLRGGFFHVGHGDTPL